MDLARGWLGGARTGAAEGGAAGSRALPKGLEIGASASNPFPGVDAWNLDYPAGEVFQLAQQARAGAIAPIHVFGLADRLPFADASLGFVLTSHVLEHMPDTLRALREWSRVIVDGGVVFAIVPHRQRTFDAGRPRTELEHHLADYATGMSIEASPMAPTSHYHVWETEDVVALIEAANTWGLLDWEVEVVEDTDSKVGNGFTIVATKRSQPPPPRAAGREPGPVTSWMLTLDLPFQVAGRTTEFAIRGAELDPDAVPRGRYRAIPIHGASFPPVAGAMTVVECGAWLEPPRLDTVRIVGGRLRFDGVGFDHTSYLEADFGKGGFLDRAMPEIVAGGLELDVAGIAFPPNPIRVRVTTLPPGGGTTAWVEVRDHL